jgi:6,7-dimethyl-8-ribityllumazine synthase
MPQHVPVSSIDPADRFGIVVAQWHKAVTAKLLDGALATLAAAGVADSAIDVASVPGSWELPVAAARMARSGQYAAVLCLGAVVKGETTHDQYINHGVTAALSHLALECDLPVLFGLLTCDTLQQALERAGGKVGNKGSECAEAALHMVGLLKNLPPT